MYKGVHVTTVLMPLAQQRSKQLVDYSRSSSATSDVSVGQKALQSLRCGSGYRASFIPATFPNRLYNSYHPLSEGQFYASWSTELTCLVFPLEPSFLRGSRRAKDKYWNGHGYNSQLP